MGERRDQYRGTERRGRGKRRRCRCDWCASPKLRKQTAADLETEEALVLWHGGEPMPEREWRLRRTVPLRYRALPAFALADYLEECGRAEDAASLRTR